MRYHVHYRTSGKGHVYQGRFKSFPIQDDEHFLTVCRHVECHALRAELLKRAEQWRWSSLWRWQQEVRTGAATADGLADPTTAALDSARGPATKRAGTRSGTHLRETRQRLFGEPTWVQAHAKRLGLESILCPRGRPQVPSLDRLIDYHRRSLWRRRAALLFLITTNAAIGSLASPEKN